MAEALPTTSTMGNVLAEVHQVLSTALQSASECPAIIEEV
jgi:hypothetical protein